MSHLDKASLLQEVALSWNELQTYIESLTVDQLTRPTDAAGWTVKDHLIHIAMWEKASLAMLEGKSKRETLDISLEVWEQDDDPINAIIQARYQDMPLDEVKRTLQTHHDDILAKLNAMTQDDLLLPYSHYHPQSSDTHSMLEYVHWDTVHHYRDHMPWMAAIVAQV